MLQSATSFIDQRRAQIDTLRVRLESASGFVEADKNKLTVLRSRLDGAMNAYIAARKNSFVSAAAKLDALSPLKVLSRGYAIAMDAEGDIIKDTDGVKAGDKLTVRLNSGALGCKVEEIYGQQD